MAMDIFLFFNGNAREAIYYYADAFGTTAPAVMSYGQMTGGPARTVSFGEPGPESAQDLLCYANVTMPGGGCLMCSDFLPTMPYKAGNNFAICYSSPSQDDIRRFYTALSQDGEVLMDLQQTFYSQLFGMVKDKMGITWQFIHTA